MQALLLIKIVTNTPKFAAQECLSWRLACELCRQPSQADSCCKGFITQSF